MKVTCLRGFNFDFPEYGEYSCSFLSYMTVKGVSFFSLPSLTDSERGKLFMIKLCASVYVCPSVATPLFIAL